jgi:hypothetical protein
MTYLASHPDEFQLENDDCRQLSISASNLFFKPQLDLEDVAPSLNFNVKSPFCN